MPAGALLAVLEAVLALPERVLGVWCFDHDNKSSDSVTTGAPAPLRGAARSLAHTHTHTHADWGQFERSATDFLQSLA